MRHFTRNYEKETLHLQTSGIIFSRIYGVGFLSPKFIWDTGATSSCIDIKIIKKLNLEKYAVGTQPIMTANGETICNTYHLDIILPNYVIFNNLLVIASELGDSHFLVGMNIINKGSFLFTKGNIFQFCIPHYPYSLINDNKK